MICYICLRQPSFSKLIFVTMISRSIRSKGVVCRFSSNQTHQTIAGRKRFYKYVDISRNEDCYSILLDGKLLKTPARNSLQINNLELALMIANEWDSQTNQIKGIEPSTMPMMMLVSTAIDQIKNDPSFARETCLSYLPTDTALFYTGKFIFFSRYVEFLLKLEILSSTGRSYFTSKAATTFPTLNKMVQEEIWY